MTDYIRVRNFEQLQHYKERDPPWIKLYHRMLDEYAFARLSDAGKWHLVGIFLLASRCGNRIAADAKWVGKKIGARTVVDLAALEAAGFLEPADDALAACKQPASPETEAETETETKCLSAGADPPQDCSKDFEEFWKNYPTDPLMSKKKAHDIWRRMSGDEQAKAVASLSGFRALVARQENYRVVHAWKYLTERRYDGFLAQDVDQAATAETMDKADRLLKRGKYAETKQ
jgi:hypothetical protein